MSCVDAQGINEVFATQPLWRKRAGEGGRQWKSGERSQNR
jgi:hypothetical protein